MRHREGPLAAVGWFVIAALAFQVIGGLLFGFGVPCLLVALTWEGGPARVLALRWPTARALVGAVLLGGGLWWLTLVTLLQLQQLLWPIPEELTRELERLVRPGGPLWQPMIAVALVPAFCEELLCRGLLQHGLARRLSPTLAILLGALAFAALHLSPHRLLPTFALGLACGVAAHRSGSVVPAMVVHLVNNAAVLVLSADPAISAWLDDHALAATAGALGLSSAGMFLLFRR